MINRRDLLKVGAGLGFAAAIPALTAEVFASSAAGQAQPGNGQTNKQTNPPAHPANEDKKLCPVCGMQGDPAISSVYRGKTYYFCEQDHKLTFEDAPEDFVKTS